MSTLDSSVLPVVGAAMTSLDLPTYRDWLIADQRDLEIQDPAYPAFFDLDWQAAAASIKTQLDGYTGRLGVHGPFWGMPLFAPDAKVRAAVSERFLQTVEFCALIGATHMVVHSPWDFLGMPFAPLEPIGPYDPMAIVRETLQAAVNRVQEIGCTLVIETIFDRRPEYWLALVNSFETDNVRASVDVGHVFINHQIDAPPVDHWLLAAGSKLGHVHLQDSDGYEDRHWVPGKGSINFHAIFAALKQINANPRLIIEIRDHSQIRQAAQWLTDQGLVR